MTAQTRIVAAEVVALARRAGHQVLASYPDGTDVVALASLLEAAAGPNVTVRHVVPARDVAPAGRNVRLRVGALPAGLFVFDHHTALVSTHTADDTALHTDRASVALLSSFFERVWADAREVVTPSDHLTDQQVTAVRLLADGHTDEAIAKRLGVSGRTARRIVMRLMARLGARGRFQAGVRAVEAGWVAARPANRPCDNTTTG